MEEVDLDLFFERKRIIFLVSIVAVINLFLFLIKFLPTFWYESVSLRSDSINSLADFGYSLVILVGTYFSYRPSDRNHPHGHERIRPFISLVVASSIIITGLLVVKGAIESIYFGSITSTNPLLIIVLLISIVFKTTLFIYFKRIAEKRNDDIIKSIAGDSKADVFASFAAILGILGIYWNYPIFDAFFGLLISVFIFKTGFDIAYRNINYLTGAAPSKEITEKIIGVIKEEGYEDFSLEPHYVGPKIHVFVKIMVSPNLDIGEAHNLEEELREKIESIEEVSTAFLHLEPLEEKEND